MTRRGWLAAIVAAIAGKKAVRAAVTAPPEGPFRLPFKYVSVPYRTWDYGRDRIDFIDPMEWRISKVDFENRTVTLDSLWKGKRETMTEAHKRARQHRVMARWMAKHSAMAGGER